MMSDWQPTILALIALIGTIISGYLKIRQLNAENVRIEGENAELKQEINRASLIDRVLDISLISEIKKAVNEIFHNTPPRS